jgi:periplasmic protein TonB
LIQAVTQRAQRQGTERRFRDVWTGKRFASQEEALMESDSRGDVYTLADIASAADSTEEEARAAAGSSRRLWPYADAVRIGRLLVAGRYAACTRSAAPLFSHSAAHELRPRATALPAVVSGSLHLGLLGALVIVFGLTPTAATPPDTDDRTSVPSRLVFLAIPGPGGGGGGGGLRQTTPPPQAASKGHETVASQLPRREPPKPVMPIPAPADPKPLPAEPLPPLIAPVVTAPADARSRAGLLDQAVAVEDSHGSGIGGGTGRGAGVGLGEGSGAGIGPGTGGGVGGGPYRAGSGITPPRLLREVKAEYTEEARRRGLAGDVVLEVVVRRDGSVGEVKLLQGLGSGLDERAMLAVRQWRFAPADRLGVAVEVIVQVGVEFRLR